MSESPDWQGDNLTEPLRRLGDALWQPEQAQEAHAACLAALPEYIQAEVAGEPVAKLYAAVKHHLDRCDTCAAEYADLLQVALAEQQGLLPRPATTPRPDFSYLPSLSPLLRERVLEWTQALVSALVPETLRDLPLIADAFFARVTDTPRPVLGARTLREAGPNNSPLSALHLLASCYGVTQDLIRDVSPQDLEAWRNAGTLARELETRARRAARAVGLDERTAEVFARAYALEVGRAPERLGQLLSS